MADKKTVKVTQVKSPIAKNGDQLRTLKDAKLVRARREGKSIFYSLDDDHVRQLLSVGLEHLMHTH